MGLKFRRNPGYQNLRGELTPESVFFSRRKMLATAGTLGAGSILGALPACSEPQQPKAGAPAAANAATINGKAVPANPTGGQKLNSTKSAYAVADGPSVEDAFNQYCNYYEFGTDKEDPAQYEGIMKTSPWSIAIEGETDAAGTYALTDLVDFTKLEERVYRHRCVEAWSMVVPWIGVPMASVMTRLKPKSTAKFVQFETVVDRNVMPGVRFPVLQWPYVEGLRMDEAMNELAFIAVGAYGKSLKTQNGAPVRTVMPWKYGFKATKSIARIRFVTAMPKTAWNKANANEYGFYSNVNPNVDHPRWSQASEQVIGGKGGFNQRRKTEMFNGYEKQVASLYAGMDLKANY